MESKPQTEAVEIPYISLEDIGQAWISAARECRKVTDSATLLYECSCGFQYPYDLLVCTFTIGIISIQEATKKTACITCDIILVWIVNWGYASSYP